MVPLCDSERCAVWRCQDVGEVEAHPVLLAQAMVPAIPEVEPEPLLHLPVAEDASRWWGVPLGASAEAAPVFEIPWHNWKAHARDAFRQYRLYCVVPPDEPFEKHHIFPQQKVLAEWFESRRIDIHAYTLRLPRSFHRWLHSGGPDGGQWNEAWRQFMEEHRNTATAADMWKFAGELMSRFGVNGPLVPYNCD